MATKAPPLPKNFVRITPNKPNMYGINATKPTIYNPLTGEKIEGARRIDKARNAGKNYETRIREAIKRTKKTGHHNLKYFKTARVGLITTIRSNGKTVGYETGPLPAPDGSTWNPKKRKASYEDVITILKRMKTKDLTIAVYGQLYPGDPRFRWVAVNKSTADTLRMLEEHQKRGNTIEQATQDILRLNMFPQSIVRWSVLGKKE
ncbi:MAG TPA: hypothetical protein VNG51_16850 [Ktedonobacteraceae bacterium]|nr:hypothetical protein [Ktedonobacteraceae bacterium]